MTKNMSDIDEDSPEEGEIRDDSSDESYDKSMIPENAIVRSNRTIASPQLSTKPTISIHSSRVKARREDQLILQNPVGRVGYPDCVQEVYSKSLFRSDADLRSEKENQLGITISRHTHSNHKHERRRGLASPEEGVRGKIVEKIYTKRKKIASQHKSPKYISQNKRRSVHSSNSIHRRKSKQEESEVVVVSDDSDIEEQIQKTKKRLKNDNFTIEKLKHAAKSSSAETISISSTDWHDLNKSSSSLEIIEGIQNTTISRQSETFPPINIPQNVDSTNLSDSHVENKSTPSNAQNMIPGIKKNNTIQHKGPSSNSSNSPSKIKNKSKQALMKTKQDKIDPEEWNLRVVALKSVIETKYGKKKEQKARGKQQSKSSNSGTDEPNTDETEPVDMDLSLTDDEKEDEMSMVMVSNQAFQQAECLLKSALASSNDGAETDSTDTSNRYIVVDEVGFSSQGDAPVEKQDTPIEDDDEELLRAQLLIALSTKQKPLPVERPLENKKSVDLTKVSVPNVSPSLPVNKKPNSDAVTIKEKFDMQALIAKYGSKLGATGTLPAKRSFANPYRISKTGNKLVRKDIYKTKKLQKITAKNYKRPVKDTKHQFLSAAAMKRVINTENPRTVTSPVLPVGPPPTANRLIIQLGQDSDTDEEPPPKRDAVINTSAIASNDLLKSVDQFLKQVRQNVEKNQQPEMKIANSSNPSLAVTSLEERFSTSVNSVPKPTHRAKFSSDVPNMSNQMQLNSKEISNLNPLPHQNSNNAPEESNIDELLMQLYSKKSPQKNANEQNRVNKSTLKESDPVSDLRITLAKSSSGTWSSASNTKSTLPQKNAEVTKKVIPKISTLRNNKQDAKTGKTAKSSDSTTSNTSSSASTKIATTPLAVRHLPSSQQMEYHLLKLEIARREELMKLKSRLGQPLTKSATTREVILHEQQPELKITVTNNVGGDNDDNVRTVRHSAPANITEKVSQIQDTAIEASSQDLTNSKTVNTERESSDAEQIDESKTPTDLSKQSILPAAAASTTKNVIQTPKAGLVKKRSSSESKTSKSPASKRRILPAQQGKKSVDELVKLPGDEKKTKLQNTESELLSKRKNMLEKLTMLASLLHNVENGQAQIVDSEARVEALKKELARAETKAEQERVALKKLFAQVGQVRVEVADTRTQCAGLAKICQVLGPKTVGANYQAPQEGMEQLRTHLQQVVELTKKTKLGLKMSSASSSSSHSSSPTPNASHSTISCEIPNEAVKSINSDLNVVPNSTVVQKPKDESGTCDNSETEEAGSTETNTSAKEDNATMTSSAEKESSMQSEIAANDQSIIDCSETPQEQVEMETMNNQTSSHNRPSVLKTSEKKEPEKQMTIRVKPLISLLADPTLESSNGNISQSVIPHSSWIFERNEISSDMNSTSLHSSRAAYHPYISPLEHMKPRHRAQQGQQLFPEMDPNQVFCPFALTGICLDDECKFQHPRPS